MLHVYIVAVILAWRAFALADSRYPFKERVYRCYVSKEKQLEELYRPPVLDIWKPAHSIHRQVDVRVRNWAEARRVRSLFKLHDRHVLIPNLEELINSRVNDSSALHLADEKQFFSDFQV